MTMDQLRPLLISLNTVRDACCIESQAVAINFLRKRHITPYVISAGANKHRRYLATEVAQAFGLTEAELWARIDLAKAARGNGKHGGNAQ